MDILDVLNIWELSVCLVWKIRPMLEKILAHQAMEIKICSTGLCVGLYLVSYNSPLANTGETFPKELWMCS